MIQKYSGYYNNNSVSLEVDKLKRVKNTAIKFKQDIEALSNDNIYNNTEKLIKDFELDKLDKDNRNNNSISKTIEDKQNELFKLRELLLQEVDKSFNNLYKEENTSMLNSNNNTKNGNNIKYNKDQYKLSNTSTPISENLRTSNVSHKKTLTKRKNVKDNENKNISGSIINKDKQRGWSLSFSGIVVLSCMLIYYILRDVVWEYLKSNYFNTESNNGSVYIENLDEINLHDMFNLN